MNRRDALRNLLIGFVIVSVGGVAGLLWLIASAAMSVPLGDSPVAPRATASHRSERPREDSQSTDPQRIVGRPPSSAPVGEEIAAATTIASKVKKKPPVRWASETDRRATTTLGAADEALAVDPDNPAALRDRAAALGELQRWPEAADTLIHLVAVVPANARDTLACGTALARLSRWPAALRQFVRLVELSPDEPRAWHNLAVAHQALGRLADARRGWDRVIELSPEDLEAHARRGEVYCDLRQWREAAADFDQVLERQPDDVETTLNLALALSKQGKRDRARRILLGAAERRPRFVPLLNRLAELAWSQYRADPLGEAGRRGETIDWCRRSLQADAEQPDIVELLSAAGGGGD